MKAKHAVAQIKGMSVWQKIFCALLAVTLLCLMVPNGLRANADTNVVKANDVTKEVTKQTDDETLGDITSKLNADVNVASASPIPGLKVLNSVENFIPSSWNAEQTAGNFTVQKAALGLADLMALMLPHSPAPRTVDELYEAMLEIDQYASASVPIGFIRGLLAGAQEYTNLTNVQEDLRAAVYIPEEYTKEIDTLRLINKFIYFTPEQDPEFGDGSIYMLYVTLGQGDITQMIETSALNAVRITPNIPVLNPGNKLLGAENAANGDTQGYFINWSVSIDGVNYIPLDMLLEYLVTPETPNPMLSIIPNCNFYFKANFWDVEGMTLVHLDFSDAMVYGSLNWIAEDPNNLAGKLKADYWYTTDMVQGSYWTKAYPSWYPTWYVVSDIFEKFGSYIFGDKEEGTLPQVVKDWRLFEQYSRTGGESVYPGAHWFSTNIQDWTSTIAADTTLTFSVYPVSPVGYVLHNGYPKDGSMFSKLLETPIPVENARVMFYNEWGFPLFNFEDARYEASDRYWYYDAKEDKIPYCYDTQIDHAVVYAYDDKPIDPDFHPVQNIYIPLRADAENFNAGTQALFTGGRFFEVDFQVERLMFADFETFWSNNGIESIEVNYLQDGEKLFDTYVVDNPWAMAMLSVPLVTNGTITTWQNTLVSGWTSYANFKNPFGNADALTAMHDQNNFEASDSQHWFQCQLIVHPKAGNVFTTWYYDNIPFSADTYAGEEAIIVKEPSGFLGSTNHSILAGTMPVATETVDGAAIYGEGADNAAIYGAAANAATPDGNAATAGNGTAQTGDSMGFAFAILAMIAIAGAGVLAGRKLYSK